MDIVCGACNTQYKIDLSKVPSGGGFIRCKTCGERVRISTPPTDAPIALPASVASTPAPSASSDAIALPGFDLGLSLSGSRPDTAIPLVGSDDVQTLDDEEITEITSTPSAAPTLVTPPAPVQTKPASPFELDMDLPAAVPTLPPLDTTIQLPQSGTTVRPVVAEPARMTPNFLDDLPAIMGSDVAPVSPPTAVASAPVSSVSALPNFAEELPTPVLSPFSDSDLPEALPAYSPQETPALKLDTTVADLPAPEIEAPSLMEELTPVQKTELKPVKAVEVKAEVVPEADKEISTPNKFNRKWVYGGGLAAVVLGLGSFVLLRQRAPEAPVNLNPPTNAAALPPLPQPEQPNQAPAVQTPEPQVVVEVTSENIDGVGAQSLLAAVKKWQENEETAPKELLSWAQFRLAWTFGDVQAKGLLLGKVARPAELALAPSLKAAAQLGALLLDGKIGQVRQIGERLVKGPHKLSPHVRFVLASSFSKRPEAPRGIKLFEEVLAQAPQMIDAAFGRASLMLLRPEPKDGEQALVELIQKDPTTETAVRAATILRRAGLFDKLEIVTANFDKPEKQSEIAPAFVGSYLELLMLKGLRWGELKMAYEVAQKRVELAPTDILATLQLAHLAQANGADGMKIIEDALGKSGDPLVKSQLIAERVRLGLGNNDSETVQKFLESGKTLPPKIAQGWLKYAEGLLLQKQGQMPAARQALMVASKGRPRFLEPKLALATMGPEQGAPLLKRLTQLIGKTDHPAANYQLALVMRGVGNFAGAAQILDRLMWIDPTVADPVDLVLTWIDALDRSGQSGRAAEVAAKVQANLPQDMRPIKLLMGMAKRNGRTDAVLEWTQVLVKVFPDNSEFRIDLAAAKIDAGKAEEAQKDLDEMLRQKPEARNAQILLQLGRSWQKRNDVKAKDYLKESLRLLPTAEAYLAMADIEARQEKTDEARHNLQEAIKLRGDLIEARLSLARLYIDAQNNDGAISMLRELLAKDPQRPEAAELLGDALQEADKFKEAMVWYDTAIANKGEDANLLLKLAKLQLQQAMLPLSIKTFRRVLKSDPKRSEAHYYLGLALKDLGRPNLAKDELKLYLQEAPKGEYAVDAQSNLNDLESL